MASGKILIVIGDAAEALDTMYPYYRVQEDGYQAVVAGPEKRVYPLVMHEIPPGWDITKSLTDVFSEIYQATIKGH